MAFGVACFALSAAPASADIELPAQYLVMVPSTVAPLIGTGRIEPLGPPSVLSESDAGLYREIFALQETGKWKAADARIAQLADRRLMGHVLAQRYMHPTAYRSKYKE